MTDEQEESQPTCVWCRRTLQLSEVARTTLDTNGNRIHLCKDCMDIIQNRKRNLGPRPIKTISHYDLHFLQDNDLKFE